MKNLIAKFSPDDTFVRLITNPSRLEELEESMEISETTDPIIQRTREYLFSVLKGDGRKAHCPFVGAIEDANAYYIQAYPEHPKDLDIKEIRSVLNGIFSAISVTNTFKDQAVDPTTVVAAFGHDKAMTRRFYEELKQGRDRGRQSFLDRGLMLAHMHPEHPLGSSKNDTEDGGNAKLYNSSIPLLMVRRMHKPDHVFMHTHEEKNAYSTYFGQMASK